jgi:hypothetical protein
MTMQSVEDFQVEWYPLASLPLATVGATWELSEDGHRTVIHAGIVRPLFTGHHLLLRRNGPSPQVTLAAKLSMCQVQLRSIDRPQKRNLTSLSCIANLNIAQFIVHLQAPTYERLSQRPRGTAHWLWQRWIHFLNLGFVALRSLIHLDQYQDLAKLANHVATAGYKGSLLLGVILRGPDPTSPSVPILLSARAQQHYLRLQSWLRSIMQIPDLLRLHGIVASYQEMINEAYVAFLSLFAHDIPAQRGHSFVQLQHFRAGLQDMKNLHAVSRKCRANTATAILKHISPFGYLAY